MRNKVKILASIAIAAFLFLSCSDSTSIFSSSHSGYGVASIQISTSAAPIFRQIAKSAFVTVSANDMGTITSNLTITDSSVEGIVNSIPAGPNRLFEISVFDSLKVLQYRGSASARVVADSTVIVYIAVRRVGGNAIINGEIIEDPGTTTVPPDWPQLPVVPDGLVAYYPFNGNAADESDHGFNGTVISATLTADRFGHPNKAYAFNGRGGIQCNVNSTLSLAQFTVAAWFKCDGPSATIPRIVAVTRPGECNCYYGLLQANGEWDGYVDRSLRLVGMLNDPYGYGYTLNYSNASVDSSSWHHGAITFASGVLKIYIDGMLDRQVSQPNASTQFSGTASLEIGYCTAGSNYVGRLDDIRIYNRVLSDAEIKTLYSSSN